MHYKSPAFIFLNYFCLYSICSLFATYFIYFNIQILSVTRVAPSVTGTNLHGGHANTSNILYYEKKKEKEKKKQLKK